MGEDTRAADEDRVGAAGLRAGSPPPGRAPGDPTEARTAGAGHVGPFELDEPHLRSWGQEIGAAVSVPVIFALRGDLGAGKSVLARAIACGAGVTAQMPSPTFNLLFQYETANRLISHLDLYRLEDASEVWELGWRELGAPGNLVLIEWPERAESLLPTPRWDIVLAPGAKGPHFRNVMLTPIGNPPRLPLPRA